MENPMCEKCEQATKLANELAVQALKGIGVHEGTKSYEVPAQDKTVAIKALLIATTATAAAMGADPESVFHGFMAELAGQYPQITGGHAQEPHQSIGFLGKPRGPLEIS